MRKDLYFIPVIAEALEQSEQEDRLHEAFQKIEEMGRQPQYARGHVQFRRFMAEVRKNLEVPPGMLETPTWKVAQGLVFELASGILGGHPDEIRAALDLIRSRPDWQEAFERGGTERIGPEPPAQTPKVLVEKGGTCISCFTAEEPGTPKRIQSIVPGDYVVKLDTGRVLWEGELTREDLLYTYAYPGQALDLAADTGERVPRMTREIRLLAGEVIIRVFPGLESGSIEVRTAQ